MKISTIKMQLHGCGYQPTLLRPNYQFSDSQTISPLVGFAQVPLDARSSCIAVLKSNGDPKREVEECRPTGAPIVFVCADDSLQWWQQGSLSAEWVRSIPKAHVKDFFDANKDDFSPNSVYRAKTWGRFRTEFQLDFVDVGLLPLVEEEVGQSLEKLIERNVSLSKDRLGWNDISSEQGHWLLKSVFWLISAKILKDKEVGCFSDLDINDFETSFHRLANHYGTPAIPVSSKIKREVLTAVAADVARFSNLSMTTTESLAHVYENTLISKATRSELGTHSTPSYLVDYIVGNLSDWIEEIPENQRSVFEPACGNAAFLVSAMRLLTELLPKSRATASRRRSYLRSRIHGFDKDPFALELARLALTLTDMPNPDGWDLHPEDMFLTDSIEVQAKASSILLANPPFEKFTQKEYSKYSKNGAAPVVRNKAVEVLRRSLESLEAGSVFGVVMPQSVLHGDFARDVREYLLTHFELREISLFPDKVFSFADVESVVLLGRKTDKASREPVRFRKIREWQMETFRSSYQAANSQLIGQERFRDNENWELRVPDLDDVWGFLGDAQTLESVAVLGQGLFYRGASRLSDDVITYSKTKFRDSVKGFVRFEPRSLCIHELPTAYWMNLSRDAVDREVQGTEVGTPQVLLNYAPVSRGPWRLKALLDKKGHPVTSRFIPVRSKKHSIEYLWAILNSPIANGFAFSHLGKRDNTVGAMRKIPLPKGKGTRDVETATKKYFRAVSNGDSGERLQMLMAAVDAEVLKQYNLPAGLECQLLRLFDGWDREGVGFEQNILIPTQLRGKIRFSDFVNYENDWEQTNRRRGELIDKKIASSISGIERGELIRLQNYADYYLEKIAPVDMSELERLEEMVLSLEAKRGL